MTYMVIEKFRGGDARPVYARVRERGRLAPAGLEYLGSWVTADLTRCYQVMRCDDPELLSRWTSQWEDLVEFEILPVITSDAAAAMCAVREA
jgi:hypothetical protein